MRVRTSPDLPTADPYLPGHGDPGWSAEHYELDLTYDVAANRLRGRAVIDALARSDISRLVLDLAHLDVERLTLDGAPPARYTTRENRIVVTPRQPMAPGTRFRMVVRYSGSPRPLVLEHHGDAGWEELDDGVIVAGQPHGAPTWFPCNDRPDDKASYSISVTTDPAYTVVSNGTLASRTRRSSTVRWTYRQDEPMSTYLATVHIGRYDVRDVDADVPMRLVVPAGAWAGVDAAFGRQPEMLATFTDLFGPYPFPGYTVVVTPDDLEIPLESQALSTFGSNFLTDDWDHVRLVAHELAHQWFGNAVTLRSWSDIWLHEGFACYAEWLWSEAAGSESAEVWARRHHDRLAGLAQDFILADPGPAVMFDDRVYKRGALTLHALRGTVGDEAFFATLRGWVAGHRGGTATTSEFRELAATHARRDLGDLFDAWLNEPELPDLPAAS